MSKQCFTRARELSEPGMDVTCPRYCSTLLDASAAAAREWGIAGHRRAPPGIAAPRLGAPGGYRTQHFHARPARHNLSAPTHIAARPLLHCERARCSAVQCAQRGQWMAASAHRGQAAQGTTDSTLQPSQARFYLLNKTIQILSRFKKD